MERKLFEDRNKAIQPAKSQRFSSYSKDYRMEVRSSDVRGIDNRNKSDLIADKSMNSNCTTQNLAESSTKTASLPVATISPRMKMR